MYRRGYYTEHAEDARAYTVEYWRRHPEKAREHTARYYAAHPEERRKHRRIRRARQRSVQERFTPEMEAFVLDGWNHRCAVCGAMKRLCLDHWLPLSRGHSLCVGNAVILCRRCNTQKSNKLPQEMYESVFVRVIQRRLEAQVREWESLTPAIDVS